MMQRALVLSLAGCGLVGTLLLLEWGSTEPIAQSSVLPRPAQIKTEEKASTRLQDTRIDELVTTALSRPLFTATRRPAARMKDHKAADPELPNLRLTGVVIEADRHFAIFAAPATKPIIRSEGEMVNEWHLDEIASHEVKLSGPSGSTTLMPRTDPNLIRPTQPQAQTARTVPHPGAPVIAARPSFPVLIPPPMAPMPAPSTVRVPNAAPDPARVPNSPRLQE
jgi:hypothetical protein